MDIVKIIQETATWIEKVNNDYEYNLFRTPELIPEQHYYDIPNERKGDVINTIIERRSKLLNNANVPLISVEELSDYGRIMCFDGNMSVVDGAPEAVSALYIDCGDMPPYDTWLCIGKQLDEIYFYNSYDGSEDMILFAWIPKNQYFFVDQGVQVSCVDNLWWADNNNISVPFNTIKSLFKKPDEIIETNEPIDLDNRRLKIEEIWKQLDKNSTVVIQPKKLDKRSVAVIVPKK